MMWDNWHMCGWGGGFMMIFWILLIAVVIYSVIRLAAKTSGTTQGMPGSETALDILKKRYAAGEISAEEFEKMKHDLQ